MIVGIGIDIIQNSRISESFATHKLMFLKKILTNDELAKINLEKISTQYVTGVFAAKEAVIKSLSNYLGYPLNFQDIVVLKDSTGAPVINIINPSAKTKLKKVQITISISHEKLYSIAFSVAELIMS